MAGKRKQGDTFASVVMAASDFDEFCSMMNMVRQGHGVAFCPPLVSASSAEEEYSSSGGEEEEDLNDFEVDGVAEGKTTTARGRK